MWRLTNDLPLSALLICVQVNAVRLLGEVDLGAIVRPRAELEGAFLVIKGEPPDVDGTRADVETERHPGTRAV